MFICYCDQADGGILDPVPLVSFTPSIAISTGGGEMPVFVYMCDTCCECISLCFVVCDVFVYMCVAYCECISLRFVVCDVLVYICVACCE